MEVEHLRGLLREGLHLFDNGRYFEAHEVWEELWKTSRSPYSLLFKGLAQLSVSLEHTRRGNLRGAASVGRRSLAVLSEQCAALNLQWLGPLLQKIGAYLEQIASERDTQPFRLPDELLSLPLESAAPDRNN